MKGVEKVEFEAAEDTLLEFVYLFQVFSHENGVHKAYRKEILDLQITSSALTEEINKPWNQERLESLRRETTDNFQEGDQVEMDLCIPSKILEAASKGQSSQIASNSTKSVKRSCNSTPDKKQVKFAKVTPKSDLIEPYKCTLCPKKYSWLKALSRHMKDEHKETVPPHLKEKKSKITCRICSTRITRDLVTRHLKNVHGFVKADKGYHFRGFVTFNESTWLPLWLENGEPDPPSELMVPIKDGKVSLYGTEYEVEETLVHESNNPEDEVPPKTASEPVKISKPEKNARKPEIVNRDVEMDENAEETVTAQKEHTLVDLEKALEELDYSVSPTTEYQSTPINVNRRSSAKRCLDLYELQDEFHDDVSIDATKPKKDGSVKELIKGDNDSNKSGVMHGAGSKMTGEQNVDSDGASMTGDEVDKVGDAMTGKEGVDKGDTVIGEEDLDEGSRRLTMTGEIIDDGATMTGEEIVGNTIGEEGLDEGGVKAGGCSIGRKLPKLKVEVFLVTTSEGEFWSSSEAAWDEDSDYDDGDDREFTEGRIEMKKLRFYL